jgi:hypothetical protein
MALLEHGFLGAEAEKTRQQILQKYADLFGLLKELNAVCHEYMTTAKCNWQSRPTFQAISYFTRGLMTYQSLIILSEHGCIDDVRALCRTLLQACFRLAAIATDPTVLDRIMVNTLDLDRKRLRFFKSGILRIPPGMENTDWDAKIAEKDALIQKLGGSKVTEQQLAEIGGRSEDYASYLHLSDAAHTSPYDLLSFLKFDQDHNLLGFNYGPHDKNLITYATYAMKLQADNLVNADKVIKFGLPASFLDLQNRSIRFRPDMPGMFNPQD